MGQKLHFCRGSDRAIYDLWSQRGTSRQSSQIMGVKAHWCLEKKGLNFNRRSDEMGALITQSGMCLPILITIWLESSYFIPSETLNFRNIIKTEGADLGKKALVSEDAKSLLPVDILKLFIIVYLTFSGASWVSTTAFSSRLGTVSPDFYSITCS